MSTDSPRTVQVLLPELGESVTEGAIVEWRKAVGEQVEEGETLVEVTTDKVDVEVPSPSAGVLSAIVATPGDTVEVGGLLAELSLADGAAPAPPQPAAPSEPAAPASLVPIVLPEMESVTEGTVVEWRKEVGDRVEIDEPVLEVTTDKVDLEVPSPAAGVLASIAVQPGETFSVATPLGEIAAGEVAEAEVPRTLGPPPEVPAQSANGEVDASPLARRLAGRRGLDLGSVTGSGPGGMVRKRDVEAAAASPAAPAAPAPVTPGERQVKLAGPAAALAGYMEESLSIPTATTFRTLNVGALDARRGEINRALAAGGRAEKLSYTHLVAWAIVRAVERHPEMGAAFDRVEGAPHRVERDGVHLGLAVDVERKDGSRSLLVPVVRGAERLGFRGFRDAYDDLVKRTRAGQVKPDELRGASVSLTNPGGFGTVASVPRLMPGQGTIVATGAIGYPPGFERARPEALRELGVDKVMTMTSTYDHRVIQGAQSGAFLREIEELLHDEAFFAEVAESLGIELAAEAAPAIVDAPPTSVSAPAAAEEALPDRELMRAVAAAMSIVKAHRIYGHLAARLDPLGFPPMGDPALEPESQGLTPALMRRVPSDLLRVYVPGATFAEVFPRLREVYCGSIAYQVEHISSHEQRRWLRRAIETGDYRHRIPEEERVKVLERLVNVDVFERFLQRAYIGQKTFSIEGVDALVPMLDETIELAAEAGAAEIVVGMAHRGRLNVITHVVGRPPESILAEFEGHAELTGDEDEDQLATAGDVKYHLGSQGTYVTHSGRPVSIILAANPSHLEQVNAVAEGATRARQTLRRGREPHHDPSVAVPVLVHGDAAFPAQGVVAETLNLQALAGYTTGGTLHIIANNQIGFTTDPQDGRSTRYASDLAKGFDIPIVHVNADDVEACLSAVRLAVAFRERFHRDILIDLVGYRRLGHNETDEPAYTQPVMSRTIKRHPRAHELYADALTKESVVSGDEVKAMVDSATARMSEARGAIAGLIERGAAPEGGSDVSRGAPAHKEVHSAVREDLLRSLNEELLSVPDGFRIHPKLKPQLERRREAMGPEGGILWAHAEALAIASLLVDGVPVRLTGQDTARGTFSQRHLELHDAGEDERWMPFTGRVHTPMAHLVGARASFELHNGPLSEAATVGFEYGYSTLAPEALVMWEAQYGDFANGAQIMLDQFLSSGRAKWGETSRLTLLLPHGYEGSGPEHSSARIERFLQLAAEDNMRVAYCSTAAQYFHLLRRQGLIDEKRPLVAFTPKSMLRSREASSHIEELASGTFRPVLDDPRTIEARERVRRLILCTGKVFHELEARPERAEQDDLAIVRIELLFPFPEQALREVVEAYPNLAEVTWVQEEPRNMGAWDHVARRIPRVLPDGVELGYVGRSPRSSPAEGYPQAHRAEQERLLAEAMRVSVHTP